MHLTSLTRTPALVRTLAAALLLVGHGAAVAHSDDPPAGANDHPQVVGTGLERREPLPPEELEDARATGLPRIRIVRTWGDLLDQPALPTRDFLKKRPDVRLGIESRAAACGGGVLVYALFEGSAGVGQSTADGHALGPLSVHLVPLNAEKVRAKEPGKEDWKLGLGAAKRLLFVVSVPCPSAGRHRLEVRQPDGKAIAAAVLLGGREKDPPWLSLEPTFEEQAEKLRKEREPLRERLVFTTRAAVPRFDGRLPFLLEEDGGPPMARERLLPQFIPEAPDPRLTLRFDGTVLDLRSRTPLYFNEPDRQLLCRWWVNGKPFRPSVVGSGCGDARDRLERMATRTDHVQIEMSKLLGRKVQSGERIAVQVLYCPHGWEHLGRGDRLRAVEKIRAGPPEVPLLTNKVEFTVP